MINTVRVAYDRTPKTTTVAVFSSATDANYLTAAKAKVAEVADRLAYIEVEEWYSERKIKSCNKVPAI